MNIKKPNLTSRVAPFFGALLLLVIPLVAFGQEFLPLTSIPGVAEAANSRNIGILLNNLYMICVGAASVLAVLKIIQGGITYMLGDSVTEKREAKHHISMAVLGLILVLSPALIFNIIDPRILNLSVDVSGLTQSAPSQSYEDLPDMCRQYSNMQAYVPPRLDTNDARTCPVGDSFMIPRACCSGLAENATCCGTNGGPGVPPDPGSEAWCVDHPVVDGTVLNVTGMDGCCRIQSGQIVAETDGRTTCHIQSASSIRSCTLVGNDASQLAQCTSAPGCGIQGSGENRICSCRGSGRSAPTCTRTNDANACLSGSDTSCFWQAGICGCGGS